MEEKENSLFQHWYGAISKELQRSADLTGLSAAFGRLKSDEQRVAFALELPCVHKILDVRPSLCPKSADASTQLRTEGNRLFQGKKYTRALELYTKSVLNAPSGGAELSLAYANRSACLFYLERYQLCLGDIDLSLEHGYPDELKYKLFDRRGKCLWKLGESREAKLAFGQAMGHLDRSRLEAKKLDAWKKELDSEMRNCRDDSAKRKSEPEPSEPEFPRLSYGHNRQYIAASSAFDVTVADGLGRHPVAARDITVGDTLIIEKPYASVLLPDQTPTHCHHCLKRVSAPVPCRQCTTVRYCSDACAQASWQSYHEVECPSLDLIHKSGIGGTGHLALRVVTKSGYAFLKHFKETLESGEDKSFGCNNSGIYDPAEYLPIFHLVTHAGDRAVSDLFRRTIMAVFLLKCLQRGDFFPDATPAELSFFGGLLLRHLQAIPCNAHEVSELELSLESVATSVTVEIASALYATLSLFNHSCDPAVTRNFYGDICVVRAIRCIPCGSQISDNYGTLSAVSRRPERRAKLREQYYFTCCCEACEADFPLYASMAEAALPVPFKCGTCAAALSLGGSIDEVRCGFCEAANDLQKKRRVLERSEELCKAALDKLLAAADVQGSLPVFISHLRLLDRLVCRPWREFCNGQEALKQCYNIMSNCHVAAGENDR